VSYHQTDAWISFRVEQAQWQQLGITSNSNIREVRWCTAAPAVARPTTPDVYV